MSGLEVESLLLPPFRPPILDYKNGGRLMLLMMEATSNAKFLCPPISGFEMGGCPEDRGAGFYEHGDGVVLCQTQPDFISSPLILPGSVPSRPRYYSSHRHSRSAEPGILWLQDRLTVRHRILPGRDVDFHPAR